MKDFTIITKERIYKFSNEKHLLNRFSELTSKGVSCILTIMPRKKGGENVNFSN